MALMFPFWDDETRDLVIDTAIDPLPELREMANMDWLDWCGACQAWHIADNHIVKPAIRERILDFIALWYGIKDSGKTL